MNLLLVVQGRAHRGLVGDPKGEARAGCIAQRPQRSGGLGGTRNLLREEGTQCRGNLLGRTVAAMKPEAQPLPRQDSRHAKAAVGCDPHRKAAWSGIPAQKRRRHAPHRRQGQFRITQDEISSRIGAGLVDCGVDGSGHGGRPVGEPPSFLATCPPASGTVRHCTTGRSKACRTLAPRVCGGARFAEGVLGCRLLKRARHTCRARRAINAPAKIRRGILLTRWPQYPGAFLLVPPVPLPAASPAANPCLPPAVPLRWPGRSS